MPLNPLLELPDIFRESLVAHFPFDETEGNRSANLVNGGASGIYQSSTLLKRVPGIGGSAISFAGDGGHINAGTTFALERTDPFSFGCWFHTKQMDKRFVLCSQYDMEARRGFAVNLDLTNQTLMCEWTHRYPDNWIQVRAKLPDVASNWHHLFVTYDGSSVAKGFALYLDGKMLELDVVADKLTESISTESPLLFGRRDNGYFYNGFLDDIRVYKRRLMAQEINQVYEMGPSQLVQIPTEERTPAGQEFLRRFYLSKDEHLQTLHKEREEAAEALHTVYWQGARRWYVNGQGQTMIVIPNPATKKEVNHSFAISSHEITVAEFRRFQKNHKVRSYIAPSDDCPVHDISWFDAAAYCNWLSQREGIPKEQWVYEPNAAGHYEEGMKIRMNYETLSGYRLPTETEWQHACSSGSSSSYYFGEPIKLLKNYGWCVGNAQSRCHVVESLLPNERGLFDMHGNEGESGHSVRVSQDFMVNRQSGNPVHGGSYTSHPFDAESGSKFFGVMGKGASYIGFRVARSVMTN